MITLLILGLILFVGGILGTIISDFSYSIFIIVGFIVVFISNFIEIGPTKQDVLNGKAIYQETQIITGNDTIKTYDIIWKN